MRFYPSRARRSSCYSTSPPPCQSRCNQPCPLLVPAGSPRAVQRPTFASAPSPPSPAPPLPPGSYPARVPCLLTTCPPPFSPVTTVPATGRPPPARLCGICRQGTRTVLWTDLVGI